MAEGLTITPEAEEVLERLSENVTDERVEDIKAEENTEAPASEEPKKGDEGKREKAEKTFTQSEVEALVQARIAKTQAKAERDRERAAAEAEARALEDNEKFEELARKRGEELETLRSRVTELEGTEERLQTYEGILNNSAEQRVSNLNLQPGVAKLLAKMSAAEKIEWLDENEADFQGATAKVEAGNEADAEAGPSDEEEERVRQESGAAIMTSF